MAIVTALPHSPACRASTSCRGRRSTDASANDSIAPMGVGRVRGDRRRVAHHRRGLLRSSGSPTSGSPPSRRRRTSCSSRLSSLSPVSQALATEAELTDFRPLAMARRPRVDARCREGRWACSRRARPSPASISTVGGVPAGRRPDARDRSHGHVLDRQPNAARHRRHHPLAARRRGVLYADGQSVTASTGDRRADIAYLLNVTFDQTVYSGAYATARKGGTDAQAAHQRHRPRRLARGDRARVSSSWRVPLCTCSRSTSTRRPRPSRDTNAALPGAGRSSPRGAGATRTRSTRRWPLCERRFRRPPSSTTSSRSSRAQPRATGVTIQAVTAGEHGRLRRAHRPDARRRAPVAAAPARRRPQRQTPQSMSGPPIRRRRIATRRHLLPPHGPPAGRLRDQRHCGRHGSGDRVPRRAARRPASARAASPRPSHAPARAASMLQVSALTYVDAEG